jgi:hypothetical protein
MNNSHWKFLGLNKNSATVNTVKQAYRKLAVKMHPNKGGTTENFQKLGSAYAKALNNVVGRNRVVQRPPPQTNYGPTRPLKNRVSNYVKNHNFSPANKYTSAILKKINEKKLNNKLNTHNSFLREMYKILNANYDPLILNPNKNNIENFKRKLNYNSWRKIVSIIQRPLRENNVVGDPNFQQLSWAIKFYRALNKINKATNNNISYYYWLAFHTHRRALNNQGKRTGPILKNALPRHPF